MGWGSCLTQPADAHPNPDGQPRSPDAHPIQTTHETMAYQQRHQDDLFAIPVTSENPRRLVDRQQCSAALASRFVNRSCAIALNRRKTTLPHRPCPPPQSHTLRHCDELISNHAARQSFSHTLVADALSGTYEARLEFLPDKSASALPPPCGRLARPSNLRPAPCAQLISVAIQRIPLIRTRDRDTMDAYISTVILHRIGDQIARVSTYSDICGIESEAYSARRRPPIITE